MMSSKWCKICHFKKVEFPKSGNWQLQLTINPIDNDLNVNKHASLYIQHRAGTQQLQTQVTYCHNNFSFQYWPLILSLPTSSPTWLSSLTKNVSVEPPSSRRHLWSLHKSRRSWKRINNKFIQGHISLELLQGFLILRLNFHLKSCGHNPPH